MMKMIFFLIVFISSSLFFSCNFQGEPEHALRGFINYRTSDDQQKDFYLKNSSGKMLEFFEKMDDMEFKKYASIKRIVSKKLKLNLKKCSDKTCSITYTISFRRSGVENTNVETEVKKIAELVKDEGNWKIADIVNIKSHFEFKEPLSP